MNYMIQKNKSQIAFEFLIIFSLVLVIFLILFVVIIHQKSYLVSIESYSSLQLIVQNIASYINIAAISGTGFSIIIPLVGNINNIPYNVSISNTGTVYAKMKIGNQNITAIALSNVHNLIINGTLIASSNSINLYNIPVYTGKLYLANKHGVIYINKHSPVTSNLSSYFNINTFGNLSYYAVFKGGLYNGNNGYIKSSSAPLINSQISVCAWVNISKPNNAFIGGQYESFMIGQYDGALLIQKSTTGTTSGELNYNGGILLLNKWTFICGIYNGTYYKGYINGKQVFSYSGPQFYTNLKNVWVGGNSFHGYMGSLISNVQIYNKSLTNIQINRLYTQGISSIPISSNIKVWYPLEGNANDYSGNNYNGNLYGNATYIPTFNKTRAYFFNANIKNQVNYLVNKTLVGYISKYGKMSSYGTYTIMKNNPQIISIQYNKTITDPLQVIMFKGNSSTIKNLKLWYPLNYEYNKNITYDLSGNNNTGIASNVVLWNKQLINKSNSMQGLFNGNTFIKSQLLNITSHELTISAWVSLKQNNTQNIVNVFSSSNSLQLVINKGNAGIMINNKILLGASISNNLLYFITGVWNGYNNTISIYVNGILNNITSATNISVLHISGFDLGASTNTTNNLNGLLSDIQIYNQSLSQKQIIQLYLKGPVSIPITNHIITFIPLQGNANDYSNNNYKTTDHNLNFTNVQQNANFKQNINYVPFSVIAWGVNDTVPSSELTSIDGYSFINYSWVAANPTHPLHIKIIQKGYFPIKVVNQSSFGWTYKTTNFFGPTHLFPNNLTDNLNFLNNGYVYPPVGINTSLGVYNYTYFSAIGYLYLNGQYQISTDSNDGMAIFWKNILNNTWQTLSNGTRWGPQNIPNHEIKNEISFPFHGIYEFAVNFVNVAGGGYSYFMINKRINTIISTYATFTGNGFINEIKPLKWMDNAKQDFTFSIWVNPTNNSGIVINEHDSDEDYRDPFISIVNNKAIVSYQVGVGGIGANNEGEACLSLGNIPLNQWTNIAMTYDVNSTGNYLTGYINGRRMNQMTTAERQSSIYAFFYTIGGIGTVLGEYNCNTLANYSGQLSNFQIYNTTLSGYQIAQMYDRGILKVKIINITV